VDVDEFLRLLQQARSLETTDPAQAVALYEAGLALYRGDFLEENLYAEWVIEERERLLMEYLMAAERLARLLLGRDEYEGAMRWAHAILAKDPLWEEAYAVLMECQWRLGHRGLAVRTFERCRKRLQETLAVEPSPRLQELYKTIAQG
jgi:DNA-binding SARP family transcriptional activator